MNHALIKTMASSTIAFSLVACGGGGDPAPAPAPAPAPSAGAASECFNIAWYTPGTTAVLDYQITGNATGVTRSDVTISGGRTFNGQNGLIEYFQDQTTTYSAPSTLALADTISTRSSSYFTENGTVETEYGSFIQVSMRPAGNIATTTTYTPPRSDRRYTLAVNTSDTTTSTMGVTSEVIFGVIGPKPAATNSSVTTTIRYVGQESITVPAGTFTTCKFMDTSNSETTEHWFAKGSGTPVRFTSRTSEGQAITMSLTSASRLNGAAIPAN